VLTFYNFPQDLQEGCGVICRTMSAEWRGTCLQARLQTVKGDSLFPER